jgi:cation:H+ antiporter
MVTEFLFVGLGLVILLLAGDLLVKGAVNLALRLGIPALIVSLTVVAFGTSAPELLISIRAVLDGLPGLAMGNVVGSNTASVLLVLGIPAIISGLDTRKCDIKRSYMMMIGGSLVFIGLAFMGPFTWWHGLILLSLLALVLLDQARAAHAHRRAANDAPPEDEPEGADPDMPSWKIGLYLVLGLIGLPLGASLLVDSATTIASAYGVSDTVIGLTLVAVGTSLPELATTVVAAWRNHAEVAIGNVIGSNLFNLLGVIGVTALIGPIPVDATILRYDLWVMMAASLLLIPFIFLSLRMGRMVGFGFVGLYIVYIVSLF